jgi:branched-subunit amino acid aminotransferase/4-amino-4-deoxychorismate lyase
MSAAQAYLNGRFVPAAQAVVAVTDAGFVQGTTVAEQLRTFGGRLFRLQQHVERLLHSLDIVGLAPGMSPQQLVEAASELAQANHRLLAPGDDLGLAIFVTPGPYAPMSRAPNDATVCMHTFPLRFDLWAQKYRSGESLATTDVAQVPEACWPSELKCRSRMHYFLADRQARQHFPGSRALMRDLQGFITETTTANVVLVDPGGNLVTPPRHKVLPGISLAALAELAGKLGLSLSERDVRVEDLLAADEVWITATSNCMLPVARINGQPVGSGQPGMLFQRLIAAWSQEVGLDIVAQASQFAERPE